MEGDIGKERTEKGKPESKCKEINRKGMKRKDKSKRKDAKFKGDE